MSAPSIPELLVSHWQTAPSLDAAALATVAVYVSAAHRVGGRWPVRRTISFLAGVGCVLVALQSGLGAFDDRLLSAHMVQHVLLLLPTPLFLLGGRPMTLALRTLPRHARTRLMPVLRAARSLARPLVCLAVFYAVVIGTHVPALFDAALRHPTLHYAQHLLYLGAGLLFLWPVVGDPAGARRLGGLGAFGYVIAAMPACAIVGAYLNRAATVIYSPYARAGHSLGVSPLPDQAQAGAIMWVGAHLILVSLALWCLMSRAAADERRQRAVDGRRAGLIAPPGSEAR